MEYGAILSRFFVTQHFPLFDICNNLNELEEVFCTHRDKLDKDDIRCIFYRWILYLALGKYMVRTLRNSKTYLSTYGIIISPFPFPYLILCIGRYAQNPSHVTSSTIKCLMLSAESTSATRIKCPSPGQGSSTTLSPYHLIT